MGNFTLSGKVISKSEKEIVTELSNGETRVFNQKSLFHGINDNDRFTLTSEMKGNQMILSVEKKNINELAFTDLTSDEYLPPIGDEYIVVTDLEDGERPIMTMAHFDAKEKKWYYQNSTNEFNERILAWAEFPDVPEKYNTQIKEENKQSEIISRVNSMDDFEALQHGICTHGNKISKCKKCK